MLVGGVNWDCPVRPSNRHRIVPLFCGQLVSDYYIKKIKDGVLIIEQIYASLI
ncbi:hypothetical protein FHS15_005520 [Paenibacillus castaneae]|nr:hypothetical protein [Paenibacillus castaneae]